MKTRKTPIKTRNFGISAGLLLTATVVAAGLGRAWAAGVQAENGCNSNDQGAPCFANVSDILQGRRRLLPVDDLVVTSNVGGSDGFVQNLVLQTANSAIAGQVPSNVQNSSASSFAFSVGRMFNLPRDVVVTMTPGFFLVSDVGGIGFNSVDLPGTPFAMTMADFTGDGLADVALQVDDAVQIVTAKDVNDLNAGFLAGTPGMPFSTAIGPGTAITAGDFNGDGDQEVAIAIPQGGGTSIVIMDVAVIRNGTQITDIQVSQAGFLFINTPSTVTEVALTAGNYDGAIAATGIPDDELVVAYHYGTNLSMSSIDPVVNADNPNAYTPVVRNTQSVSTSVVVPNQGAGLVRLVSGGLDWFGAAEQVVVGFNQGPINNVRGASIVFTLDGNLNLSQGGSEFDAALAGIALGNFGQALGPNDPPNLEIAKLIAQPNNILVVNIYQADPQNNFALSRVSFNQITSPIPQAAFAFAAGDTQGRSLLLGPPDKATVTSHIQPDTILGLPPMHVDWITPAGGSAPDVLNVSVFPASFNAQYNFQDTTGKQASRKSTTSYTAAFKESAEEKISYGVPAVDSVSVTLKQAATQTHQNTVAKTYNTYQGNNFQLTAQTVFDDLVAATAEQFNIYSYPVIGHCVPVSGAPPLDGCPAGTAPLHVQFSGPDNVVYGNLLEGATFEWYQPVHEPGNVLSYPGSLDLLKANQPEANPLQLLTDGAVVWDSQASQKVSVDWSNQNSASVTSGSVSTHSFDTSVSTSASTNIEGIGLSGSASFDYNQSRSLSTLNTAANTYSESTGVTVNRGIPGGPTSSDNYLYQGQSFIFGQEAPTGTIHTNQNNQNDPIIDTNIQGQGFLAVGFAADPLSTGFIQSGNWWKQAYTAAPDVALNHPQRWLQKAPTGTNPQQVYFNCPIGFTSSQTSPACTPISQTPTPANVADALFYQMKGLFVTPGTATAGPQITQTAQGQTVTLQARVYNYSLTDMPAGTTVHVQFYAQPWDATTGQFQNQAGNSNLFAPAVFIGEDQLAPIPAFCGGSQGDIDPCAGDSPPQNWVLAQTTWDTSTVAADTDWKFWVVAWMEQGGQLVQEIQDHGLGSIPAGTLNSLADVPIETYSNNLGFYNQTFHVASASPAPATGSGGLAIDQVVVPSEPVLLHEPVVIRASHRSGGSRFDSVLTLFYDGDPEEGGVLFDQELIPRIRASDSFVAPVPYRPRTCGTHQIFVQAIPTDGSAEPVTGTATIQVTADFPAELASLRQAIQAADLPQGIEKSLLAKVKAARDALHKGNAGAARGQIGALENEIRALNDKKISPQKTKSWIEEAELILGCLP